MADFVAASLTKSIHNNRKLIATPAKSAGMKHAIFDCKGRRKYLAARERDAFLRAALETGGKVASFCTVLAYCGARISEVLALTPECIDDEMQAIVFRTLKKRGEVAFRAIPVPRTLLNYLQGIHHYRGARRDPALAAQRLWSWSRTTAWRHVKRVMQCTSNPSYLSTPRALRHAFGARANIRSVNLNIIQKWMGHADIRTTQIYADAMGPEERALARRTWPSKVRIKGGFGGS